MAKQIKPSKKTSPETAKQKKSSLKPSKATVSEEDAMVDAFIMEVDEEVKNDNLKAFFKKYGLYVLLVLILVLSATVSFETIKNWRDNQFKAKTDSYITANYAPTAQEKITVLEKIAAGKYGIYSELARIQIADLLFEQDKNQEALDMLEIIVSNDELNPRIRNLAALKAAAAKIDTAPYSEIEALLHPVIAADDSWSPVAQEYLALAAIKNNKTQEAKDMYEKLLQDSRISEDFRNRIRDMLTTLADL